jgi:hypothetical protein
MSVLMLQIRTSTDRQTNTNENTKSKRYAIKKYQTTRTLIEMGMQKVLRIGQQVTWTTRSSCIRGNCCGQYNT